MFQRWQQNASLYAAEPGSTKKKFYALEMLPYPSGALHMATFATTDCDALARYMWMNDITSFTPWDGFLRPPAENAAIQNNTPARVDAAQHRQHEGADEALALLTMVRDDYVFS